MTVNNKNGRGWNFDNSYARLSEKLYSKLTPVPVRQPQLVIFNDTLAAELGLTYRSLDKAETAAVFAGNVLPDGSEPLAQGYAGHQFGYFTMLGDGRAIVLGEQVTPENQRVDIQMKGSGRTPYSRNGDGRATLYAMLREYLISEAMHYLHIPSSRSLAVVKTGEKVYREEVHEGAVLTRVASSHIRVGTFEFIKNYLSLKELREFTGYTIDRHYPELKESENPALELLKAVMHRQIDLVVNWLRVGFIHGVMNTDNMSVAGETFDYGPCAFINAYDPNTAFSSIDTHGRYAFGNQPRIALWNLTRFADALLPLIHKEEPAEAVQLAENVLNDFPATYEKKRIEMMGIKAGFQSPSPEDTKLILDLLQWMQQNNADYTNTFLALQSDSSEHTDVYSREAFQNWYSKWKRKVTENGKTMADAVELMRTANPVFIPRNYLVEQALEDATHRSDYTLFHQLLEVYHRPYETHDQYCTFQEPPKDGDVNYKTFCGT
jgi:serine/tyrosine/threonine adenylyltransferase